jgi:hypothetical protein
MTMRCHATGCLLNWHCAVYNKLWLQEKFVTELRFPRLGVDGAEGTRFDTVVITVSQQHFAPPALPFSVSPLAPALQCGFLHLPAGWIGEQHPSPIRMWIYVLEGQMDFETSDGDVRRLLPGSALLLEDTTGRGHSSRVVGDRPATLAVVRLPE